MTDLDQLAAFVAIAERGTVTAAARKLHRSQSAISRRLALLEDELGAPLFDRRGAKLALTDVGRAFLPFAERALAAVASGREAAMAERAPGAGSVSLAVVGTLVEPKLAHVLGTLLRAAMQLHVLTASSTEVSRLVRRGEANLGVRYLADDDPELVSERIGVERMCVVESAHHPPTTPRRWIGFPPRSAKDDFGRLLRRQLAAIGTSYAGVMTVDSLSAQKRLVEAGVGSALVPESSVREEVGRGSLVVADAPRIATAIPIVLIFRRESYLSPAARELSAALKDVFANQRSAREPSD
jgi:DNA-binding transcriptional LysR family regulator